MKGRFLLGSNKPFSGGNIYADKSSTILTWLLEVGIEREYFSLRDVAKEQNVSVGLVQKVFGSLVSKGLLQSEGLRTSKRFFLEKPELLLKSWLEQYSVVEKCKMWTYQSGLPNKEEILKALKQSTLTQKTVLALHSAAEAHGCKNTNLQTLELYMVDPGIRTKLEKVLQLEPQERGYEVLLVEPYYKSLLKLYMNTFESMRVSPALLTFLDLYHFPLRGHEQAEFMAKRIPELKRIY